MTRKERWWKRLTCSQSVTHIISTHIPSARTHCEWPHLDARGLRNVVKRYAQEREGRGLSLTQPKHRAQSKVIHHCSMSYIHCVVLTKWGHYFICWLVEVYLSVSLARMYWGQWPCLCFPLLYSQLLAYCLLLCRNLKSETNECWWQKRGNNYNSSLILRCMN